MKHASIRFHTHEPDYIDTPSISYNWFSNYWEVNKTLSDDALELLEKPVSFTHYNDTIFFTLQLLEDQSQISYIQTRQFQLIGTETTYS